MDCLLEAIQSQRCLDVDGRGKDDETARLARVAHDASRSRQYRRAIARLHGDHIHTCLDLSCAIIRPHNEDIREKTQEHRR